jgi:hypothetical protein
MVAGMAWGVAAGWVLWMWWRTSQGELAWQAGLAHEPGVWHWTSAAYPEGLALTRVTQTLSLERGALLHLGHPLGTDFWVWIERGTDAGRWRAMRRALQSHGD